jgi:hypothetical protein
VGNVPKDVWLLSLGEALGPAGASFLLGLGGIAHGLKSPLAPHFVGGIGLESPSASNNSGINTVIAVCGRTPVSGVDQIALLALKMLAKVGLGNTKRCGGMSEREASAGAKGESMACSDGEMRMRMRVRCVFITAGPSTKLLRLRCSTSLY